MRVDSKYCMKTQFCVSSVTSFSTLLVKIYLALLCFRLNAFLQILGLFPFTHLIIFVVFRMRLLAPMVSNDTVPAKETIARGINVLLSHSGNSRK